MRMERWSYLRCSLFSAQLAGVGPNIGGPTFKGTAPGSRGDGDVFGRDGTLILVAVRDFLCW